MQRYGIFLVTGGGFEVRTGTEVSILGPGYGGGGYVINVIRRQKMSKKIMDERGRLFGVINIIDVIVILLAVVLVCGVYVKFSRMSVLPAGSSDLQEVTYQMEIKTVREGPRII